MKVSDPRPNLDVGNTCYVATRDSETQALSPTTMVINSRMDYITLEPYTQKLVRRSSYHAKLDLKRMDYIKLFKRNYPSDTLENVAFHTLEECIDYCYEHNSFERGSQ